MELWKLTILHPTNAIKMKNLTEEFLRKQLITYLTNIKQFPKSLIVKEKKISTLPNLIRDCHLDRRIDLLIYTPTFQPLLLIECKATAITVDAMKQVLGYNYYIGAPCVSIINQQECILQWKDLHSKKCSSWEAFPSYPTCMDLYLSLIHI